MAQKCRKSRRSSGNRARVNTAQEERRQGRFTKKSEDGKAYEYKPIPYNRGTAEYRHERLERVDKTFGSKLPLAKFTSIMSKLDNQLAKEKSEHKAAKERKSNKRAKTV